MLLKAEGKDWAAFGELLKDPRLLDRLCSYDLGAIPPAARGRVKAVAADPAADPAALKLPALGAFAVWLRAVAEAC